LVVGDLSPSSLYTLSALSTSLLHRRGQHTFSRDQSQDGCHRSQAAKALTGQRTPNSKTNAIAKVYLSNRKLVIAN